MGLFRRKRPEPDWIIRLEAIERRMKVIEADWEEWFDKYRRLYARLSKRVEREESPQNAPEPTNGAKPYRTTNPLALAILRGARTE